MKVLAIITSSILAIMILVGVAGGIVFILLGVAGFFNPLVVQ